jgi:outer membrane protein TolC
VSPSIPAFAGLGGPVVCLVAALCADALAAERESLPSPLTLEYALSLATGDHPVLEKARAQLALARAARDAAGAAYGTRVDLEAVLKVRELADSDLDAPPDTSLLTRTKKLYEIGSDPPAPGLDSFFRYSDLGAAWVPSPSSEPGRNDSSASLRITRQLYDFGRTRAAVAAAESGERAGRMELMSVRQQCQLEIMSSFFDVILADRAYTYANEAMAAAYVRFDKARDRNQLGQVSDVRVLELESRYQGLRREMHVSRTRQRAARSRLAMALNRPDDLPPSLAYPKLPALERESEDLDALIALALERNPRLQALHARTLAGEQRWREAQRDKGPVLSAELEASIYAEPTRLDDALSAALKLRVPLWSGGRTDAEVARQRALLRRQRAELAKVRLEVRQAVLDLWLKLQALEAERVEVEKLAEYRELALDQRRALYELEVAATLGDAMAETARVRLRQARAQLRIALAWAELDALTGRLLERSEDPGGPGTPTETTDGGSTP